MVLTNINLKSYLLTDFKEDKYSSTTPDSKDNYISSVNGFVDAKMLDNYDDKSRYYNTKINVTENGGDDDLDGIRPIITVNKETIEQGDVLTVIIDDINMTLPEYNFKILCYDKATNILKKLNISNVDENVVGKTGFTSRVYTINVDLPVGVYVIGYGYKTPMRESLGAYIVDQTFVIVDEMNIKVIEPIPKQEPEAVISFPKSKTELLQWVKGKEAYLGVGVVGLIGLGYYITKK